MKPDIAAYNIIEFKRNLKREYENYTKEELLYVIVDLDEQNNILEYKEKSVFEILEEYKLLLKEQKQTQEFVSRKFKPKEFSLDIQLFCYFLTVVGIFLMSIK